MKLHSALRCSRLPFQEAIAPSVFGVSLMVALPNAAIAVVLQFVFPDGSLSLFGEDGGIVKESAVWTTFTFLLGIVMVFRTSQCYARWWEGSTSVFNMRAEWFDAVSTVNIFISHCGADPAKARRFKEVIVRLMSLLHGTALSELERGSSCLEDLSGDLSYTYDLISPDDLDMQALELFRKSDCKVELVYGWILSLIMEHLELNVLTTPAPLLTRAFQELANGLVQFHSALRLVEVPFPLAYERTCNGLLILHWLIAPIVTSQWTTHPMWAGLFSFIQVFVLCLLNQVADDLANPFGTDANDIDGTAMQTQMNTWLLMTLAPGVDKAPVLMKEAADAVASMSTRRSLNNIYKTSSFCQDVFDDVAHHANGGKSIDSTSACIPSQTVQESSGGCDIEETSGWTMFDDLGEEGDEVERDAAAQGGEMPQPGADSAKCALGRSSDTCNTFDDVPQKPSSSPKPSWRASDGVQSKASPIAGKQPLSTPMDPPKERPVDFYFQSMGAKGMSSELAPPSGRGQRCKLDLDSAKRSLGESPPALRVRV